MGPRSFNRGRRGCKPHQDKTIDQLQWGRGLSTAEGFSEVVSLHVHQNGLQWGRGLSTAEGLVLMAKTLASNLLQWGRGLSTAEGQARV